MIQFNFENDFAYGDTSMAEDKLLFIIENENKELGEINIIFCNDDYLLNINQEYLQHDTYTDIVTLDYTVGDVVSGDLYISTERVSENAMEQNVKPIDELNRVMYHGVLHLCGYNDKTEKEQVEMRAKEDYYLNLQP